MKLYVDTQPNEPMDASTAERFREVEVPEYIDNGCFEYYDGYNDCVTEITRNIAKAKEQP